jgi:cysteine desulfurase / selenocysteine lyase
MNPGAFPCPPRPLADPLVPAPRFGSRELFPELEVAVYLAHAAISPLHLAATRHIARVSQDLMRGGTMAFPPWAEQRARLRQMFAQLWNVEKSDVALTAGTSYGIRDLAFGLPLESGDEIVTFEGEFPANVVSFLEAAKRRGARVHFLPRPDPRAEDVEVTIIRGLEERLRFGARYVALSAVQFQTGLFMPLWSISKLAHDYGARVLVDAIQCAGAMPLDVGSLRLDAVTVGAHKWLLGVEGAGALYVEKGFYDSLRPSTLGWESLIDGERFLFDGPGHLDYERPAKPTAEAFEGSTPNVLGHAALEAGLEICMTLGDSAIFEHVQRYHDALEPALVELGFRSLRSPHRALRSNLLCFDLPAEVELPWLVRCLRERGIVASSPDGRLRFAPHFSNAFDEVELVISEVRAALEAKRP